MVLNRYHIHLKCSNINTACAMWHECHLYVVPVYVAATDKQKTWNNINLHIFRN